MINWRNSQAQYLKGVRRLLRADHEGACDCQAWEGRATGMTKHEFSAFALAGCIVGAGTILLMAKLFN